MHLLTILRVAQVLFLSAASLLPGEQRNVPFGTHELIIVNHSAISAGPTGNLTIPFSFYGMQLTLEMNPYSVRDPDYGILVAGVTWDAPEPITYRGVVSEFPGSWVAGSIKTQAIRATVDLGNGLPTFTIKPLRFGLGLGGPSCLGVYLVEYYPPQELEFFRLDSQDGGSPPSNLELYATHRIRLAIDVRYRLFQSRYNSSVADTVAGIEDIINTIDCIYRRDLRLCLKIKKLVIRETSSDDPYVGNSVGRPPDRLMCQVQDLWSSGSFANIMREDVIVLTSGALETGDVVGAAGSAVCDADEPCPFVSDPVRGGAIAAKWHANWGEAVIQTIVAHEIGHTLGATHTPGGIMEAQDNIQPAPRSFFSPVSVAQIERYVALKGCLLDCEEPGDYLPSDPVPLPIGP